MPKLTRRHLIIGSLLGGGALATALKPQDQGAGHSAYFKAISKALDTASAAKPTLVIDKQKLLANIKTLKSHIGHRFAYRIVAKSLPSIDLLKTVMAAADTQRLMLFHQPFLTAVAQQLPDSDVLLGKPLPIAAAARFYQQLGGSAFSPSTQLQWLIDTPQRLQQYADLATERSTPMRINIEIDVGLHRGGVQNNADLTTMLVMIQQHPLLTFSGLMGYEPHIVKVPGNAEDYRTRAMNIYRDRLECARQVLGHQWPQQLTLNAGGSPTYQLYDNGDYPFNELAAGSCLVQPTDFDIPSLGDHISASFIATPVLKAMDDLQLPVDYIGSLMSAWNPNRAKTFFTYGGYWKADPVSPPGLSVNPLYGRSTNQEMLNGSNAVELKVDDWVFLRPTQSEFVFLQFGTIAVYDSGHISEYWPVLSENT